MDNARKLFFYLILFPALGYLTIMFGSLWLEPISWLVGFNYELWDTITFLTKQHRLVLYVLSILVGWGLYTFFYPMSISPVHVVNTEELKPQQSAQDEKK